MLAFLETVRIFGSKVSALARSRRSGALGLAARSQSTSALGLALTSRVLGPKVTTIVTSLRKLFTILVSTIAFSHPFNVGQLLGAPSPHQTPWGRLPPHSAGRAWRAVFF